MSDWEKIWNKREFNEAKNYEYNGYKFKNEDEYDKFIFELTKNIEIKNNQKILDIGCGNGSLMNKLFKNKNIKNYELTGIDFCIKNIQYANLNYKGTFITHNIKDTLPFEDNTFDVILCISTLFYLETEKELINVLNEIDRVGKEDCIIFLGNCMDFDKKHIADKLRQDTHPLQSNHLYIKKNILIDYYKNKKINITDLEDLNMGFYSGQKYKFNMLIEEIPEINIGIDFHDTLSYDIDFI